MSPGLRADGSAPDGLLLRTKKAAAPASTITARITATSSGVTIGDGPEEEVVLEDADEDVPDVDSVDELETVVPVFVELEVWLCEVSIGRP